MEKEFVTFEIAKIIKKLGFNEPCLAKHDTKFNNLKIEDCKSQENASEFNYILAPLWQQTIDWIAEKYKIEIATTSWKKEGTKDEIIWVYSIEPLGKPCLYGFKKIFPSKVEALKFAIEEALKPISSIKEVFKPI